MLDCDTAVSLNPECADAYSKRSFVWFDQGDYVKALDDADKAILLDPSLISAYLNRAVAHVGLGLDEEADRDMMTAAKLGFDDLTTLLDYIDAMRLQRSDDAPPFGVYTAYVPPE